MKEKELEKSLGLVLSKLSDFEMTFWHAIAMQTRFVFLDEHHRYHGICKTAMTDMDNIYINPEFWKTLSFGQRMFVILHELTHIVRKESFRMSNVANHALWNIASDIVINDQLMSMRDFLSEKYSYWKDEYFEDIEGRLGSDKKGFEKYKGWSTEEIYIDLFKNAPKIDFYIQISTNGQNGNSKDSGEGEGKDFSGKEGNSKGLYQDVIPLEEHGRKNLERKLAIAKRQHEETNSGKRYGNGIGWLEDYLVSLNEPEIRWQEVLKQFITNGVRTAPTWSRAHIPLYLSTGSVMPTLGDVPHVEHVLFMVDSSSSMTDEQFDKIWSEVVEVSNYVKKISIAFFTSELVKFETYHLAYDDISSIVPDFRFQGGTSIPDALESLFRKRDKAEIEPWDLIVIASDMESPKIDKFLSQRMLKEGMDVNSLWIAVNNMEESAKKVWEHANNIISIYD